MFTIPTTPQEIFESATKFYGSLPASIEDMKAIAEKVQTVLKTETANNQEMVKTYQKAITGKATAKEISDANKQAMEFMKTAAFFGLISIPGALFVLPTILESAREHDLDLIPKSVAEQFNI